jgi:phosphatidylserine/phosphatidylglycerophosphate/cardiolipin synthase-like enzyme
MVISSSACFVLSQVSQAQSLNGPIEFFYAPKQNAHQPIVDAINQASKSVKMVMFHLSDPDVGNALISASKRGVNVRVIFDRGQWRSPNDQNLVNGMKAAGVNVVQATTGFRITHEKAMVIDDNKAMISTMNQIKTYMKMFDMGIFTSDQGVINEWNQVFEVDWQNAASNGHQTPALSNSNLLWSPVNSADRLIALIGTAQERIELTVENLGHEGIQAALIAAAQRGVAVRVVVPKCDVVKPAFNLPFVQALRAGKVDARMMPGPATEATPYLHAKSIVVDQSRVYLGSENFSLSSITLSREVGIIAQDSGLAGNVDSLFESIWGKSTLPPEDTNYKCAAFEVVSSSRDDVGMSWLNSLMIQPSVH